MATRFTVPPPAISAPTDSREARGEAGLVSIRAAFGATSAGKIFRRVAKNFGPIAREMIDRHAETGVADPEGDRSTLLETVKTLAIIYIGHRVGDFRVVAEADGEPWSRRLGLVSVQLKRLAAELGPRQAEELFRSLQALTEAAIADRAELRGRG